MSYINNISNAHWTPPALLSSAGVRIAQASRQLCEVQETEPGNAEMALSRAVFDSSFRIARTRAIRAEILNRTYETPERIDRTVERLLDVIG